MTESQTETTDLQCVVPEGCDPLDDLTVRELDIVGRQLKCDPYEAVGGKDGLRWTALARLAWLWAKRRDAQVKLDPFLDYKPAQISVLLGLDDDEPAEEAQPAEENPTEPGPAS